jgi:hypothetical protein
MIGILSNWGVMQVSPRRKKRSPRGDGKIDGENVPVPGIAWQGIETGTDLFRRRGRGFGIVDFHKIKAALLVGDSLYTDQPVVVSAF